MNNSERGNHAERYKVVFWGGLRPGYDRYSVKAKLASHFQILEKEAEMLFSGAPVLILEEADRYRALEVSREFEGAGAVCEILEAGTRPVQPAGNVPVRKPAPPVPPSSQPQPATRVHLGGMQPKTSHPRTSAGKVFAVILGASLLAVVTFRLLTPGTPAPRVGSPPAATVAASGGDNPLTLYADPKGNYSIRIPRGYRLRDTSSGNRSKRSFVYHGGKVSLTLLASPMNKQWLPEAEMMNRVGAIENGRAGAFSAYRIEHYGLVEFNDLDGYEILMTKGAQTAHAYALVSPGNTAFSVAIVDMGGGSVDHDRLDESVRQYLIPVK